MPSVLTVTLASDPKPMTPEQLKRRAEKMARTWPTLSDDGRAQWAGLRNEIELAVQAVETWQHGEVSGNPGILPTQMRMMEEETCDK